MSQVSLQEALNLVPFHSPNKTTGVNIYESVNIFHFFLSPELHASRRLFPIIRAYRRAKCNRTSQISPRG